MPNSLADELHLLAREAQRLWMMHQAGEVGDRAYHQRLVQIQERRHQLRSGVSWEDEQLGHAMLK